MIEENFATLHKPTREEFQDSLRKHCMVDDQDNLIIEMIERTNFSTNDWKYTKTFKLPVSNLGYIHDIYMRTKSHFSDRKLPVIYFDFYLNESFEVIAIGKEHLHYPQVKEDAVGNMFIKDESYAYPACARTVRRIMFNYFGERSGYDKNLAWTSHTHQMFKKYVRKHKNLRDPIENRVLGGGLIPIPFGYCKIEG